MATLGKNHGHQWGDSMATSGEKPWPQLGRIRWPLTLDGLAAVHPFHVTVTGVLAHLFMIHNVRQAWLYQGNGPLWSMAYESQLYLLFPALYWACKRYPSVLVCGAAIVLDFAIHHGHEGFFLLGLLRWFAIGILAADIYRRQWVRRIPILALVIPGLALLVVAYLRFAFIGVNSKLFAIWGGAYLLLLISMTRVPDSSLNPMNLRVMRWVGLRSYSLYAIHLPVLWIVYWVLSLLTVSTGPLGTALLFAIGVPLSIAVAQMMFELVEQPSLRRIRALGAEAR
jgi:peptidoglycan/LPS O-acetylase OafA/YrhL